MFILPGFAFAYSISSGTDLTGNAGLTTITKGVRPIAATGVRSRANEIEMRVERCVDAIARNSQQHRVTIRCCMCDHFGADIARGSGSFIHDELLVKPLRKGLGYQTSKYVRRQSRREPDNDMNCASWVVERRGKTRQGDQGGATPCESEQSSSCGSHRI